MDLNIIKEYIKANLSSIYYIALFISVVVLFLIGKYAVAGMTLAYLTDKALEKFINSGRKTSWFLIEFFVFVITFFIILFVKFFNIPLFKEQIILRFFSVFSLFFILFLIIIFLLQIFYLLLFKGKKPGESFVETFKIIILNSENENSDDINQLINLALINSVVLVILVLILNQGMPNIGELISEDYITSYLAFFFFKILDFIKEKMLQLQ